MNRRSFIQTGLFTSLSPALLQAIERKNEEKTCVFIYLEGGITHVEFLNPIPDAPVEYRSLTGSIKTKSGWDIGGSFSNLAKISDKFTGVRSLKHPDGNHYTATHAVMTGHIAFNIAEGGNQKEPSFGSLVAQNSGDNPNGVPTYVKTSSIRHDKAGWLGVRYDGFDYNNETIKNLALNIPEGRFNSRLGIMDLIDGQSKNRTDTLNKQWTDLKGTATKVLVGDAGKMLDVKNAEEKDKLYYGVDKSGFGRNLLIARRSLEAGAKFVTVQYGGWDMHSDLKMGFERNAVDLDIFLSAFILDLEQRGMLKNTLIVVCSEFGRTPKINQTGGRDHYPSVNSLILAGGNYSEGLIGTTDKNATSIIDGLVEPKDLCYTVLNHFNFDKSTTLVDSMRRPRHIIDDTAKIIGE